MTTTHHSRICSIPSFAISASLFAAALLCNVAFAQDTSDTPKSTTSSAVKKTERVMSDTWITTKVKSEILANSVSKMFKVGVKTRHGVVHLSGKLPTQDAIDLVKMIAEKVRDVKSVDVSLLSIGT
jgi:hyperosmotically inducible protein